LVAAGPPRMKDLRPNTKELDVSTRVINLCDCLHVISVLLLSSHYFACSKLVSCLLHFHSHLLCDVPMPLLI
jgi:hypothetical protein